jgi:hypothetical protein
VGKVTIFLINNSTKVKILLINLVRIKIQACRGKGPLDQPLTKKIKPSLAACLPQSDTK